MRPVMLMLVLILALLHEFPSLVIGQDRLAVRRGRCWGRYGWSSGLRRSGNDVLNQRSRATHTVKAGKTITLVVGRRRRSRWSSLLRLLRSVVVNKTPVADIGIVAIPV